MKMRSLVPTGGGSSGCRFGLCFECGLLALIICKKPCKSRGFAEEICNFLLQSESLGAIIYGDKLYWVEVVPLGKLKEGAICVIYGSEQ